MEIYEFCFKYKSSIGHNEAWLRRSNFLYREMRLWWQIVWPYSDIRCIWAASCNICRGSRNRTSAPCPRDRSRHWRWTAPWMMTAVVAVVAVAAGPAIADAPVARTGTTPRPSHRSGPSPARFAWPNAWNPSSLPRFFEDHFALRRSLRPSEDKSLHGVPLLSILRFLAK